MPPPEPLWDGQLVIGAWHDPLLPGWTTTSDLHGLADTWAAVIGPTAVLTASWLARHTGWVITVADVAAHTGTSNRTARDALTRLVRFGLARRTEAGIDIRVVAPPLTVRQRQRLPAAHPAHLATEGAA